MKNFTTQQIRDLLNQVYHEEISFSRMVEILNEMVSEAEEPNFKEGDFLHSDWGDENITIIFKNQAGDNLYYHASKPCYYGVVANDDRYWRDEGDFRIATEAEKQELLNALAKEGKRWNEEKKCVEDIPKRRFQKGDRVRIKDGFKPEEHRGRASFVREMYKYIGKDFYVDRVEVGYIISDGWAFDPDWLEPYEELKEGDLAIFWDGAKRYALVGKYNGLLVNDSSFQHKDQSGFRWRNAIKFESKEQYERFIKGEI